MSNDTAVGLGNQTAQSAAKRTRALAACTACRSRRTKCLLRDGATSCNYCLQKNLRCIIRDDDERKKPTSKTYVGSLTARIELLENMLQDLGHAPPALDTGTSGAGGQCLGNWSRSANGGQKISAVSNTGSNTSVDSVEDDAETLGIRPESAPIRGVVRHGELNKRSAIPETSWKVNTPLQAVTQTLSLEEQDYLMDLYWKDYNLVVNLVPEADFRMDEKAGKSQWYSEFLHLCLMAVGARLVDSSWPARRKIMPGGRESQLHKLAKDILERGGQKPSGLPMVQALLLLGDLESSVGRLESGWMYARRASEIMLALEKPPGTSDPEIYVESTKKYEMVLWACIMSDHWWTIFFNRPTGIKDSDLLSCQINNRFGSLNISRLPSLPFGSDHDKYESLTELTRLMMKIMQSNARNIDEKRFDVVTSLDKQLRRWCDRLPERLAWRPENTASGHHCYFLEHQHFHEATILLHWRAAQFTTPYPSPSSIKPDSNVLLLVMSRKACLTSALQLADVLKQGRVRFAAIKLFIPCLLNTLIAAAALIASIAVLSDPHLRHECLQSLQDLVPCLEDMMPLYQPAERIYQGLSKFLRNPIVGLKAFSGSDSFFENTIFALNLPATSASQDPALDTLESLPVNDAWADTPAFIANDAGMTQTLAHAHNLETTSRDTLEDVNSFLGGQGVGIDRWMGLDRVS